MNRELSHAACFTLLLHQHEDVAFAHWAFHVAHDWAVAFQQFHAKHNHRRHNSNDKIHSEYKRQPNTHTKILPDLRHTTLRSSASEHFDNTSHFRFRFLQHKTFVSFLVTIYYGARQTKSFFVFFWFFFLWRFFFYIDFLRSQ